MAKTKKTEGHFRATTVDFNWKGKTHRVHPSVKAAIEKSEALKLEKETVKSSNKKPTKDKT